jgi:hypothetical protein
LIRHLPACAFLQIAEQGWKKHQLGEPMTRWTRKTVEYLLKLTYNVFHAHYRHASIPVGAHLHNIPNASLQYD